LGHAAAIFGAFSAALAAIIVRRIGTGERDIVLLMFPLVGILLVMGGALPFNYTPMQIEHLGATALIAILGLAGLNFLIKAFKEGEAAIVAPMQYSQMIWALIIGYLAFDEQVDLQTILGASVIILSGLYIVFREGKSSENTPVRRSRSRILSLRIGPFLKASQRRTEKRRK